MRTVALLLAIPCLWAQPQADWSGALQLGTGHHVRVTSKVGHTVSGTLTSFTSDTITLHGDLTIPRREIGKIQLRTSLSPARRARRGAIIGAALAGMMFGLAAASGADTNGRYAGTAALGIGLDASIGAAIGASLPQSYWTIYQAP